MRRRKRHIVAKCVLAILILGCCTLYICREQVEDVILKKAAMKVTEKILTDKVKAEFDVPQDMDVSSMVESMDDADANVVKEIVKDNMSKETVSDVSGYIKNGDMSGLKQYVKDNLSGEDQQKIQRIYEKYKDSYGEKIEEYRQNMENK